MSDEKYGGDIHAWIEPEIEARLVAMILGEASEFESEELERLMEERPEIRFFKRRLEVIHGLLGVALVPKDDEEWQLSPARKAAVLEVITSGKPAEEMPPVKADHVKQMRERRIRKAGRRVMWAVAACLGLTLFLIAFLAQPQMAFDSKMERSEAEHPDVPVAMPPEELSLAYRSAGERELPADNGDPFAAEADSFYPASGGVQVEDALAALKENNALSGGEDMEAGFGEEESGFEDDSGRTRAVPSRVAKVNASSVAPAAEPVPVPRSAQAAAEVVDGAVAVDLQEKKTPDKKSRQASLKSKPRLELLGRKAAELRNQITNGLRSEGQEMIEQAQQSDRNPRGEGDAPPEVDEVVAPVAEDERKQLRDQESGGFGGGGGGASDGKTPSRSVPSEDLFFSGGRRSGDREEGLNNGASPKVTNDNLSVERAALPGGPVTGNVSGGSWHGFAGGLSTAEEGAVRGRSAAFQKLDAGSASVIGGVTRGEGDSRMKGKLQAENESLEKPKAVFEAEVARWFREEEAEQSLDFGGAGNRQEGLRMQNDENAALSRSGRPVQQGRNLGRSIDRQTWEIPLAAWEKIQSGQAGKELELNADGLVSGKKGPASAGSPEEAMRHYGIPFPPGASVVYEDATGVIEVQNTPENLKLVESLVQSTLREIDEEQKALEGLEKYAERSPKSTFSLHVSDVSFKLARASLARGEWPLPEQVRTEEFINSFDYGDPAPNQDERVSCRVEQAAHPFLQQRNLMRISMRTAAQGRAAGVPLRLTVLLDNSGSMDRADRVESVKSAFRLLAGQLTKEDRVTLISFARTSRLLADRMPGDQAGRLVELVESTPSEGGTNLEQALRLGVAKASEQKLEGGQNRIVLVTDGAANLGNARPEGLVALVEKMRQQGIAFDACGVGADGYNDEILESLTRKGDGRYYFLDRPEDADSGFARQIAGALRPAARNVKVQVNFNPARVGRYKLYGFEKHRLKKEDFRNDSIDAAEMAAEEAGNAVYQVEVLPGGSGHIGTVSVRFQDTETDRMVEETWTILYQPQVPYLEEASSSLRLASGAALLGEKLKGTPIGNTVEMTRLSRIINSLPADYPADARVKHLVEMTNKVRELGGE